MEDPKGWIVVEYPEYFKSDAELIYDPTSQPTDEQRLRVKKSLEHSWTIKRDE